MRYETTTEAFKALLQGKELTCYEMNKGDYLFLDDNGDLKDNNGDYAKLDGDIIYRDRIKPRILPAFANNFLTLDTTKFSCGLTDCDICPFKDGADCIKVEWTNALAKLRSKAEKWLEEGEN